MKALSKILAIVIPITLCITACDKVPQGYDGRIMVLSLSSDGHYAISSDISQHVVLWDLQNHSYKVIASKANIYSAYFIKNTNDFMLQSNKDNEVRVINVDGKEIKTFNLGFPSYGQVMTSDLNTYIASDIDFNTYKFNLSNKQKITLNTSYCLQNHNGIAYNGPGTNACDGFESAGKPLTFDLSPNEKYLVGGGFSILFVWNLNTNQGKTYIKNNAQTYALITPDGKSILSADNGGAVKCSIATKQCSPYALLGPGIKNHAPKINGIFSYNINTIKFIDSQDYLIFYSGIPDYYPYAALYNINSPIISHNISHNDGSYYTITPLNYLPLIDLNNSNPIYPALQDFVRDQAIDTSPSAHILVMGQQDGNGILVYQYDPQSQTLKQVWTPIMP